MAAIEIKSLFQLEFNIKGKVYNLNRPSLGQLEKYENDLKQAQKDGSSIFALMIGYMTALGLPEEVAKTLCLDEFNSIIEALSNKKKD